MLFQKYHQLYQSIHNPEHSKNGLNLAISRRYTQFQYYDQQLPQNNQSTNKQESKDNPNKSLVICLNFISNAGAMERGIFHLLVDIRTDVWTALVGPDLDYLASRRIQVVLTG